MARSKSSPAEPWSSVDDAWAEIARLVNRDGEDAATLFLLRHYAPVWSQAGSDAWFSALRALRDLQSVMDELGPVLKRLKRRVGLLDAAAARLETHLPGGSDKAFRQLSRHAQAGAETLEALTAGASKYSSVLLPSNGHLRESPTSLVAHLLSRSEDRPAMKEILTSRGLALYSIATEREKPCGTEGEFRDGRMEAWKQNLKRARRGH